jgi:predicted dehydrogenase
MDRIMKKIKIGQIGISHEHAAGKMKALRLLSDIYEIVGVVDDRATTDAAKFVSSDFSPYEGLEWLSEEELFRTPGLDAVVVEVPNLDLVPVAYRCLERNLPIHMDKPGGEDLVAFAKQLCLYARAIFCFFSKDCR